jgi:5-methylcytosine-specific restriction endonuclease McrA
MLKNGGSIHELNREYIMLSLYLLIRHIRQYYVFTQEEKTLFRNFFVECHQRWQNPDDEDRDVLSFSEHRQQDQRNVEARDLIIRQLFFQYVKNQKKELLVKDQKRAFNEAEKIMIYRRDKGLCQACLKGGKSEKEATVGWPEYEADHVIPHAKGGPTKTFNAQVLCRYHNAHKGAR